MMVADIEAHNSSFSDFSSTCAERCNLSSVLFCYVLMCGLPEEAACRLQQLPDAHQLPLHILQLKEVAEDELVLSHGLLTDHNTQRPLNLQIMICVALQQACWLYRLGLQASC